MSEWTHLEGRSVLVGVTGGIAAYKTAEVVSRCVQAGADVSVVMTASACRFVGPLTFEALSGRPVHVDMWKGRRSPRGEHIALAERAEVFCIAPATANVIAKMACGLADDLLSATALTVSCPVLIAPAMNSDMWAKPAVRRNVATLGEWGVHVIGPEDGWLACGKTGPGRMSEPAAILDRVNGLLGKREA